MDSVGVSCTGTGETFVRATVARRVAENAEAAATAANLGWTAMISNLTQTLL